MTPPFRDHYLALAPGVRSAHSRVASNVTTLGTTRRARSFLDQPTPVYNDMAFALTGDDEHKLARILSRYPNKMAACIPVLHLCQEANGKWVSDEVIQYVADKLALSTAHVKGVATFYSLFNRHVPGKHQLWVCRTLSCALRGGEGLLAHCEQRLGVVQGETTKDGKITLRSAECLASCGTAPMVQIDKRYYENLDVQKLDRLLDELLAD